ncbi:MAG: tripartite tricarboxylate transporter substrate binding protein [Burkholderiales bacterium]|nr:tripartite tricarboxylate transporter substrate binding protein [Burkholderiales bacterium]
MCVSRRQFAMALAAVGPALLTARAAAAQDSYPGKPVRFIVPFAAGGPADVISRLVGSRLQEQLGQPVVIDNIPGAGSTLGVARLSKLPADGYSIGFAHTGSLGISPHLYKNVGYDPVRDLTPIARLCDYVNLLVVNASSPFRTLDDLLAAARAKPGLLSYGSAGIGSSNHLSGELLAIKAGVTMTHVPYRGSALAMNDLLGGGLQFMFDAPNTSTPHLRAGKLRALGTTGRTRHRLFADLPAIAESVPGYEFSGWMGLMAPAGLPKPIQQRLVAETEKALATPGTGDRLSALGLDVNFGAPDEVARAIVDDLTLWGPLIKSLGVQVE